tara:strand:+ start:2945 stop:3244 length:300 start_codon:yes stop_codon:yes gene_type:complete
MEFEWDERKDQANRVKHGISFETATGVFGDPKIVITLDEFSFDEERWKATGLSENRSVLRVVYTERMSFFGKEVIRIISARKADKDEKAEYYQIPPNSW